MLFSLWHAVRLRKTVAIPGTSEHHTGLAIDIVPKVDGEWKWENEDMMNLPELFAIIHKELPKHGFILRYPKNKEKVTGYSEIFAFQAACSF